MDTPPSAVDGSHSRPLRLQGSLKALTSQLLIHLAVGQYRWAWRGFRQTMFFNLSMYQRDVTELLSVVSLLSWCP